VVAVMVYHANPDWLPGGFLGVEVFFVISGYLITLLLISEKERTSNIDMKQFWIRRARRLLPALFTMMIALSIWTALFERDSLGKLRGDVIAAFFYVSNWYQIWTGAGYTASNDFAPLRHLWSLAVEEQFYLIWPVVMFALLRGGSRKIADISRYLVVAALAITVVMAVLYYSGPVGTPEVTPDAYWTIFGRDISKIDALYLSTITRASGLLLGAAFAMIWRPVALMRGPLRTKGRLLDGVALVGFVALGAMAWWMYLLGPDGADPWLFRGGFVLCAIATLMMIAAVTHQRAMTSRVLSIPVLLWIGTRSYGLYLYHWPIYQLIRNIAGNHLKFHEFVLAMVATGIVTEASYRFIETPIRKGTMGASLARIARSPVAGPRNALLGVGAVLGALTLFAGVSLATEPVVENEVRQTLEEGAEFTCDVVNDPTCSGADPTDSLVATGDTTAPDATTDPSGSSATPPPPVETTTTTTLPPGPIAQLALGDSVMLGAAEELTSRGYVVDAAESRQFSDGLAVVEQLDATGRLGDVVVVHLGTNGNIEADDLTAMMNALADVPQVLLLTIDVDRAWTEENNALIFNAASSYQNVSVLYWADLAASCPGDCFQSDGFHLRPDGRAYYAALIEGALQAPA
ncbi:MAG TPA: acyltransferase family protein, partial [Ilumatobacteraceae bacterium]|nr:acyltransferase family protein [Ilumatobacteraceae bacterium]